MFDGWRKSRLPPYQPARSAGESCKKPKCIALRRLARASSAAEISPRFKVPSVLSSCRSSAGTFWGAQAASISNRPASWKVSNDAPTE
jgi:hypothetical protein